MTPYEAWRGRPPIVQHMRTFGCMVHVKRIGPGVTKLSDRSTPMVFVGYEEGTKGYRVYDPSTNKVQVTRDVLFEESRPWNWEAHSAPSVVSAPRTFTVEYITEHGTTEVDTGETFTCTPRSVTTAAPATPVSRTPGTHDAGPSTPAAEPNSPELNTPVATRDAKWVTPLTHDDGCDVESGQPRRYRRTSR